MPRDGITVLQQQLGQIGTILSGHAGVEDGLVASGLIHDHHTAEIGGTFAGTPASERTPLCRFSAASASATQ